MDNREAIINSALKLFCKRGYDAVGVQEIVDQAGITKPTLYYYFGSKQGLLKEILTSNSAILEKMLREAIEIPGDIPKVLFRVARAYFDFAASHWEFYLFMVSQFHSGHGTEGFMAVYPLISRYYQYVVKIFEDASDVLGNMNGRQGQFAVSFMGILDSHMMTYSLNHNHQGDNFTMTDESTYEIVRQFLYGIYT